MDKEWDMVREFHRAFGHPEREFPKGLSSDRVAPRAEWMLEEIREFQESGNLYEQADAMIDLIYFALGTLVEMGTRPEYLFKIVHEANMAKRFEDGSVRYNDTGKTIKPQGWVDPMNRIIDEIESQRDIDKI